MCKKIFLIAIFGLSLVSKVSLAEETELHFIGVTKPEEKGSCSIYANVEEHELCVVSSSLWRSLISGLEKDYFENELKCGDEPFYMGVASEYDGEQVIYQGFKVRTTCLGWGGLGGDILLEVTAEGVFLEGAPAVFQKILIQERF